VTGSLNDHSCPNSGFGSREGALGLLFLADHRVLGQLVFVHVGIQVAHLGAARLGVAHVVRGILLNQLARSPRLIEELLERALRDIGGRIFVELRALRDLRSLGRVSAVAQDIAAAVVRVVQQGEVSLAGQLRALRFSPA